jgi:hypothetical protein
MVQEMLEVDIIQPSQSYFSSLVMMDHKKEGSWNISQYYRELNKMIIKDKFLVPIIDELLYELQGPIFFTRLYFHSRYHQIILRKEGIPKIEFKTHEVHYEFLAILFGLTSAPYITFQILMNYIFKPFS